MSANDPLETSGRSTEQLVRPQPPTKAVDGVELGRSSFLFIDNVDQELTSR